MSEELKLDPETGFEIVRGLLVRGRKTGEDRWVRWAEALACWIGEWSKFEAPESASSPDPAEASPAEAPVSESVPSCPLDRPVRAHAVLPSIAALRGLCAGDPPFMFREDEEDTPKLIVEACYGSSSPHYWNRDARIRCDGIAVERCQGGAVDVWAFHEDFAERLAGAVPREDSKGSSQEVFDRLTKERDEWKRRAERAEETAKAHDVAPAPADSQPKTEKLTVTEEIDVPDPLFMVEFDGLRSACEPLSGLFAYPSPVAGIRQPCYLTRRGGPLLTKDVREATEEEILKCAGLLVPVPNSERWKVLAYDQELANRLIHVEYQRVVERLGLELDPYKPSKGLVIQEPPAIAPNPAINLPEGAPECPVDRPVLAARVFSSREQFLSHAVDHYCWVKAGPLDASWNKCLIDTSTEEPPAWYNVTAEAKARAAGAMVYVNDKSTIVFGFTPEMVRIIWADRPEVIEAFQEWERKGVSDV